MRVKVVACHKALESGLLGPTWTEYYDRVCAVDDRTAMEFAEELLASYNKTLDEGALVRRHLVSATLAGPTIGGEHEWVENAFVAIGATSSARSYDCMRCRACGITGRRYGGRQVAVVRDKKYANVIYDTCTPSPLIILEQSTVTAQEQTTMTTTPYTLTPWYETAVHGAPGSAGIYETCASPLRAETDHSMYRAWLDPEWTEAYGTLGQAQKAVWVRGRTLPPLFWRGVHYDAPPPVVDTPPPSIKRRIRATLVEEEDTSPAQQALFDLLAVGGKPRRVRRELLPE